MVNKVILIGNLGRDPEVRFTPSGRALAKFPLATTEKWTDQSGQKQERTEWHNIVVWGKQAESCGQYLAKGRQVFVEGSIRTSTYDDKEGNKRYFTEVVARDVRFLGGGGGGARSSDQGFSAPPGESSGPPPGEHTAAPPRDDVPF